MEDQSIGRIFLSVEIAFIALQRYLDLDLLIVACTAPGPHTETPQRKSTVF